MARFGGLFLWMFDMSQESRLALVIDSTKAKPSADELARSMRALDDAGVRVTSTTNNVSRSVGQMASQTDAAARSLKRGLAAVFGGLSVMRVIDVADEWGQMASRMKMATQSADEYERAQARMLQSSNATFRHINETREAFIQLSPVLRQMGLSLDESMDAIDAFSGLMVVNAASADRGAAAMRALSVSFQKGKIDADQWITIYSTLDSIVDSIAAHTGRSAEEIRKLGASGKLSVQEVAQSLAGQFEPIMAQVEEMPTTVRDAMTKAASAFTEYIGKANEASGVTATMADGITFLGENLGTVLNAGAIAGAGALAVYTSRTIGSTAATVADILAKRAAAVEELKLAQAQAAETAATLAQASAQQGLTTTRTQLAAVTAANIAAEQRLAAARAAIAGTSRSLLGVLGGPVGLLATIGLTATAFISIDGASARAKLSLDKLTGSANEAADAFAKLGSLSRQAALDSLASLQADQMRDATVAMSKFVGALEPTTAKGARAVAQMRSGMENELKMLVGSVMSSGGDVEQAVAGLIDKWVEQGVITRQNANDIVALAAAMAQANNTVVETSRRIDELSAKNDELNASARAAAGGVGTLNDALAQTDEASKRYLESLQSQAITAGLKTRREQLEALVKAGKLTYSPDDLKRARDFADAYDAANKAMRGRDKTDHGADYLKDLRERVALVGKETEYEQLLAKISTGSLTFRTSKQRELAEQLAQQLDAKQKEIELENILRDLRLQQSTTQMQFMRDLQSFGQGDRVRELNADLAKVEDRYRGIIEARRNSPLGLSDAELAQIKESLEKELGMVRDYHEKKMEYQSSWLLGLSDGLNSYAAASANVYAKMSDLTKSAFDDMFDAASKWAMGMDVTFGDVLRSYAQMMLKMQMQSAASPIFSALGGLLTNTIAGIGMGLGGSLSVGSGFSLNSSLGSMSDFRPFSIGGFTGPGGRFEPAGIVHRGEGVLNQDEIRAIGGEAGFNALRRAIRSGGNAIGGMGGRPSLPPALAAPQQDQRPNIVVNSTIHAAPGMDMAAFQAALDERDAIIEGRIINGLVRGRYPV